MASKNKAAAEHQARDDSGRDATNYGEQQLRDPVLKDESAQEVSESLTNAGITDIMALPSGYVSEVDTSGVVDEDDDQGFSGSTSVGTTSIVLLVDVVSLFYEIISQI